MKPLLVPIGLVVTALTVAAGYGTMKTTVVQHVADADAHPSQGVVKALEQRVERIEKKVDDQGKDTQTILRALGRIEGALDIPPTPSPHE